MKELENLSGIERKQIYREGAKNSCYFNGGNCQASNFAEIFAEKLQLKFPEIKKLKDLTKKIEEVGVLDGKTKRNIAGVVIYSEIKEKNLQEISKIAEIDAKTIKNTYEELILKLSNLGLEIKENESLEEIVRKMEELQMKDN